MHGEIYESLGRTVLPCFLEVSDEPPKILFLSLPRGPAHHCGSDGHGRATVEPGVGLLDATSGNILIHDGPAAIVVFLVALPLYLGITLASGAPMIAGVTAGVVGGIVIGMLSGSHVGVSGPTASLVVIVLTATQRVGSYRGFLVAVVLSGLLPQYLFPGLGPVPAIHRHNARGRVYRIC